MNKHLHTLREELKETGSAGAPSASTSSLSSSLPTGGRTGQVLAKVSNVDWDCEWSSGRVLSVVEFGAVGDGVTDDTAAVAATIAAAAPGDTIYFPKMHLVANLVVSKSLRFLSDKISAAVIHSTVGSNLFRINGSNLDLTFEGLQCRYTGPWANQLNEGIKGFGGTGNKLRIRRCSFTDEGSAFFSASSSFDLLDVRDSVFNYTHGRASCGVGNVNYDHPCVAILGAGDVNIILDNTFNGLVDPTFTGVDPSVPASQKTPADGFHKTAGYNPSVIIVARNFIKNYAIEGIIAERAVDGESDCVVCNNVLRASTVKSGFFANSMTGVRLAKIRGATIENNYVNGSMDGITVQHSAEADTNRCTVRGNTLLNVLGGVACYSTSDDTVIENNHILNSSSYARSVTGGAEAFIEPCHFMGIHAPRGWVRNNSIVQEEPEWDETPQLISRAGDLFTLDDASGIAAGGILISYASGTISYFRVLGVSGNVVTVETSWGLPSVTSGPLYYEAKPHGSFHMRGGIGNSSFDPEPLRASENLIVGALYDFATQNTGLIREWSNTVQGCHARRMNQYIDRVGPEMVDGITAIRGTASANDAQAGQVGEFISSTVAPGSGIALSNGATANVTSISLTAGDWDVEGWVNYSATSAKVTSRSGGITTTSATLPTDGSRIYAGERTTTATTEVSTASLPRKRLSIASTTTVYMVAVTTFSAGSVSAHGGISARRVR